MNYFAITYFYAPDSQEIQRLRPEHREFLGELKDQGILVGSGPFQDEKGGALIIVRLPEPSTVAIVQDMMDNDPFYKEGALDGFEIREWHPVLNVFGE